MGAVTTQYLTEVAAGMNVLERQLRSFMAMRSDCLKLLERNLKLTKEQQKIIAKLDRNIDKLEMDPEYMKLENAEDKVTPLIIRLMDKLEISAKAVNKQKKKVGDLLARFEKFIQEKQKSKKFFWQKKSVGMAKKFIKARKEALEKVETVGFA